LTSSALLNNFFHYLLETKSRSISKLVPLSFEQFTTVVDRFPALVQSCPVSIPFNANDRSQLLVGLAIQILCSWFIASAAQHAFWSALGKQQ
jgi:hypothetical protein